MVITWVVMMAGIAGALPACEAPTERVQAAAATAGPAEPSFADFRPSKHGFAFVNSFRGSPLPVSLGALEERLNVPERFGLCGGMCFAAADYYLAGRSLREEVPQADAPKRGTSLYDYLYARQAASLAPFVLMFTRFVEWMELPTDGPDGTHARTAAEMPSIVDGLDAGEPVLLGLVLVCASEVREPWRNHQVLAYGYTRGDCGSAAKLRIYDPNFPDRDDVVIRWCDDRHKWHRIVPKRSETHVRGFFRMPYVPVQPPRLQPGS